MSGVVSTGTENAPDPVNLVIAYLKLDEKEVTENIMPSGMSIVGLMTAGSLFTSRLIHPLTFADNRTVEPSLP